jgi:hypothetical protein
MAISRMQQPRQMYGLGSFVKKAVKGVTGAAKSAVKGITGAVKDNPMLALAALNFAPALFKGGASTFFGGKNAMFGLPSFLQLGTEKGDLLKNTLKVGLAGTVLGGALSGYGGEEEEATIGGERNVEALRAKLTQAYRNLRYPEEQIPGLVENDLAEYTMGAGGYAEGGRIGYALGDRAEDNAMQASGIMGLPLNQNPAGVTELDLRDSGGFIPPVGVKEKADDIPAMLSNNEFVFTADAVRGMGDGDVNKGAERMYSMMKTLENGGRV